MKFSASTAEKPEFQLFTRNTKDLLYITLIYCFAHGLILLNNGLFWDDWVLSFLDKNHLLGLFAQAGAPYTGYIDSVLFSLPNSIVVMRALVFAAFLLAALLLYAILTGIKEIDRTSRFLLVVLFAVFPVNGARIALIDFPYAITYFAFFLSFWLTSKYLAKKNPLLRVLALVGFFYSFTTNSLLFFYVLVLLYIAYREDCLRFPLDLQKVGATLLRYIDFVVLPVFFWVVRYLFLSPYGTYVDYNALTLGALIRVPFYLIYSFYSSFVQVIARSVGLLLSTTALTITTVAILAVLCLIALCLTATGLSLSRLSSIFRMSRTYLKVISNHFTQWYRPAEMQKERDALKLFGLGLLFFSVGVFPYLVVGKVPTQGDWSSRHQLLVPLGASFMLFYGFKIMSDRLIRSSFAKVAIISAIIALFVAGNVVGYLDYQRDWYKEVSLIDNLKKSDEIKNHTTFLFDDKTASLNANDRTYRFYEYSGMLHYDFGGQSRFASDASSFNASKADLEAYSPEHFLLKDYKPAEPDYVVTIGYGSYPMTYANTIKLMYYEKFNSDQFRSNVDKIVTLKLAEFTEPSRS